ncbi:MAG: branched-chain amino acid ABC transporter permease [Thermoproteota archaeon]
MSFPIDAIIRSVYLGSLYSLMALGLTMTYKTGRFPNFAHGELITIGAYVSAVATRYIDFTYSIVIALLVSAFVASVMYAIVCAPLLKRIGRALFLMVATFSLGLMIRSLIALLADIYGIMNIKPLFKAEILFNLAGVNISSLFLWTLITSWTLVIFLHMFLVRTSIGKKMRAAANNPQLATVCGINTDQMAMLSWAIAGILGGAAGAFWGAFSNVTPYVGWLSLLTFFAASVIGGMTSFFGTIAGGYLIAFAENLLMDTLNIVLGIDIAFKPLISFLTIVLILLIRPTGFAGISLAIFKLGGRGK